MLVHVMTLWPEIEVYKLLMAEKRYPFLLFYRPPKYEQIILSNQDHHLTPALKMDRNSMPCIVQEDTMVLFL